MRKVALSLVIFLLIFGSLAISVEQIVKGSNIKEKIEEKRTTSLPEMDLSSYIPSSIEGFTKKESFSPDNTSLSVWDAESGWATSWESTNISYDVPYHDLFIDLYKFNTSEKASEKIIDEIKSWGGVNVETLEGFPLIIATQEHDYEDSASADTFIGYYQDEIIIYIELSKQVMDGTVTSNQLLKEGKRIFRAIIEQSRGESDKKENWMESSDQKDSTSNSDGSNIHDIHAEATLIRDSETRLPTKIKIENTSSATWKKVKVTINPGFFGGGYTYKYPIVGPKTTMTIGIREFAKSGGKRFNPYSTKINEIKFVAYVNGFRDFQIFK